MAIEKWSNDKFANFVIAGTIISICVLIAILIIVAWVTSNQEYEMYIKNGYQKCVIFNPNNGEEAKVWQKECQKIDMVYMAPIVKKGKK